MHWKARIGMISATVAFLVGGLIVATELLELHPHPLRELYDLYVVRKTLDEAMRSPPIFDSKGRLLWHRGKTEVPCPQQGDNSLVLLLIGQSNVANHAEHQYRTAFDDRVVNFFDGKCYSASSPLLGATGSAGESWSMLGDELIRHDVAKNVVLISIGIDGSPISRWAPHGDLYEIAISSIKAVKGKYKSTHILWHQGETDFKLGTTQTDYEEKLRAMIDGLRSSGVQAAVYVSTASKCTKDREWSADNPITRAQRNVIDPNKLIFPGVNTDALLREAERHDGCHFSRTGQLRFAQAWREILQSTLPGRGTNPEEKARSSE